MGDMEPPARLHGGDVAELQQQLGSVQAASNEWLKEHLAADKAMDQWAAYVDAHAPDAKRRLHQQEAEAREDVARRNKEAQEQAEEAQRLAESLDEIRTDSQQLAETLHIVEQYLSTLQQKNEKTRAELLGKVRENEDKLGTLRALDAKFAAALGLHFEPAGDDLLKVAFTLIDPLQPDRRFQFLFNSDRINKVYTVSECNPALDRLEALVAELNASNNISAFFKAIRSEFQHTLSLG